MTELEKNDKFLSSEEEFLFEELKLVQRMSFEADAIYSKWEQWLVAAETVLIIAMVELLFRFEHRMLTLAVIIIGVLLSVCCYLIQAGNHIYATARLTRWEELEGLLTKKLQCGDGTFMRILEAQREERAKHSWYKYPYTTT